MENFDDLARGARELYVHVEAGDIVVRVGEGPGWSLDWSSDGDAEPAIKREGTVLRIRQRSCDGREAGFAGTSAFGNFVRGEGISKTAGIGEIVEEVVTEGLRSVGGLFHARLNVRLTLPPGVDVIELGAGQGWIAAEGVKGQLRLKTGYGQIALRAAAGEAELAASKGDVEVDGFEGDLKAKTGYGRVGLARVSGQTQLKSGNGAIDVIDSDGTLRASSGNGDVVLTSVGGDADVKTGRGAVTISAARGLSARATTGMGAIVVDGGSVKDLHLNTNMGAVRLSAELAPGRYQLATGMGAIDLQLASGVAARVDAQSGYGQVQSDFPLVRVGRSGPLGFGGVRMVGSIGEGEPRLDLALRTGKGEISLRRADTWRRGYGEATTQTQAQAEAPRRDEPESEREREPAAAPTRTAERSAGRNTTRAVLEALAHGEITPAEAEDLLSGISRR